MMRRIAIALSILVMLVVGSGSARAQEPDPMPSLVGKIALVTGSTRGLGREVARRLGDLGAHVIVHGRNEARAREVVNEINQGPGSAQYYLADFVSLDQVRDLVARIERDHSQLHVLINNAAIFFPGATEPPLSEDGYESTFQVNYLAHYMLTELLLPMLRRSTPSRIINVSSRGQLPIDFDQMTRQDYSPADAYMQSKLAQVTYTFYLARKLEGTTVSVYALHPANMMTDENPERLAEGARAVIRLAASPDLALSSGAYFNGVNESTAHDQAYDHRAQQQLEELSRNLVGLAP